METWTELEGIHFVNIPLPQLPNGVNKGSKQNIAPQHNGFNLFSRLYCCVALFKSYCIVKICLGPLNNIDQHKKLNLYIYGK